MTNVALTTYEFDRIELFLTSEYGWDGGTAKPTTHAVVAHTLEMLAQLKAADVPEPSLCMGSGGEICFVWQKPKFCAVIEVYNNHCLVLTINASDSMATYPTPEDAPFQIDDAFIHIVKEVFTEAK